MTRRINIETIREVSEYSHDDGAFHGEFVFQQKQREPRTSSCKGLSNSDPQLDDYLRRKNNEINPDQVTTRKRHKSLTYTGNSSSERNISGPNIVKGLDSDIGSKTDIARVTQLSNFAQRWNPFRIMGKIPNPEALKCQRLFVRRNALCDPEQMPMPQDVRERLQKDVERRKHSFMRKFSVYIRVRLGTDGEVDLF